MAEPFYGAHPTDQGTSIEVPGRSSIYLLDREPEPAAFREDVLEGLGQTTKALPSKYFYDERGSALFEKITRLPVYYLTETELALLQGCAPEVAGVVGPECLVVEYGTGDSRKAEIVLEALEAPAGYVPVDISRGHLVEAAREIARLFPELEVYAVCADYMGAFTLPEVSSRRVMAFFPGSTIGNFTPEQARAFLETLAGQVDYLLIGVDLKKDRETLEAAYNDPEGITAAFNKNLLVRINRELDGEFDLEAFAHRAVYNKALGRVEMHLVSRFRQEVTAGGEVFVFQEGETIHTENSYKYDLEDFAGLAREAGFTPRGAWTDPQEYFSVHLLRTGN